MRNASGKMPGATVAITLNNQATPVPIAMRVNMFSFIVRTDVQPRSKNGQPAHNTTGVARTSWIHAEAEVGLDRRQRHVDDRGVQHHDELGGPEQPQGEPPAPTRDARALARDVAISWAG